MIYSMKDTLIRIMHFYSTKNITLENGSWNPVNHGDLNYTNYKRQQNKQQPSRETRVDREGVETFHTACVSHCLMSGG